MSQFADGRLRVSDCRGMSGGGGCVDDGTFSVICSGANRISALGGDHPETRGPVKPVTLHTAGVAIGVETARGQPAEELPAALARAHQRSGATTARTPS